ncbi:hypothetical protein [Sorangium sp. So ce1099]|uniref:hypothetical protein n=1 Tax=Sorangium sp. So ce1099 TaxID=3133331 RepID=UPI003F5E896D
MRSCTVHHVAVTAGEPSSEQQSDSALARQSTSSLAPPERHGFAVDGTWKGWNVRATGLYGGTFLCAAAIVALVKWTDPMKEPKDFILVMIACVVSGAFFTAANMHGRLEDALKTKEDFRKEMERIAERSRRTEDLFLQNRLSSMPPAAKATPEPGDKASGSPANRQDVANADGSPMAPKSVANDKKSKVSEPKARGGKV